MKDIKILTIGGKGGGITEGLIKCLRLAGYSNITLLEYSDKAAHLYRVNSKIIMTLTPDDGYSYIGALIQNCIEKDIKVIVPGPTWEAKIISEYKNDFTKHDIIPLVNNFETIQKCDDKWESYLFLKEQKLGTPVSFLEINDALLHLKDSFPVVVKPRTGHGSQNLFVVNNKKELLLITEYLDTKNVKYLIQKQIRDSDKEYTVGIISDKNGNVIESIIMQRYLSGGYTGYAKVCKSGYINQFSEDVAKKIKSTGPLNIQLRLNNNNEPEVFEINPRFSGSAPMRAIAGFNEVDMILRNFVFNEKINKNDINYNYEFYRVFQEVCVDYTKPGSVGMIKDYI